LKMMAAAQPFLSGAISKTINMPEESTIEDIMDAYVEAWKHGLKAVAIYRDNSKRSQPLAAAGAKKEEKAATEPLESAAAKQQELFAHAHRRKLPSERKSITHKFNVGGHEGYITVGMYEDNQPGEVFIKISKEGSTLSGVMDGFALTLSLALQYGVPLKTLVDKLANTNFEPSGWTGNQAIPYAKSLLDYIARWLGGHFISASYLNQGVEGSPAESPAKFDIPRAAAPSADDAADRPAAMKSSSSVICATCGMLMTPNGSCYKCGNCGATSGCS
jgi:ribonucleoside-diphosphate reductase alpha chain